MAQEEPRCELDEGYVLWKTELSELCQASNSDGHPLISIRDDEVWSSFDDGPAMGWKLNGRLHSGAVGV